MGLRSEVLKCSEIICWYICWYNENYVFINSIVSMHSSHFSIDSFHQFTFEYTATLFANSDSKWSNIVMFTHIASQAS
jgi:hypothetical protein